MNTICYFKGYNAFLSNFFQHEEIIYRNITASSVESLYQSMKSDNIDEQKIISNLTPGAAKKAGHSIKIKSDWDLIKLSIMEDLLRLKFKIPFLKNRLKLTRDSILIEGNWWGDIFWGQSPI